MEWRNGWLLGVCIVSVAGCRIAGRHVDERDASVRAGGATEGGSGAVSGGASQAGAAGTAHEAGAAGDTDDDLLGGRGEELDPVSSEGPPPEPETRCDPEQNFGAPHEVSALTTTFEKLPLTSPSVRALSFSADELTAYFILKSPDLPRGATVWNAERPSLHRKFELASPLVTSFSGAMPPDAFSVAFDGLTIYVSAHGYPAITRSTRRATSLPFGAWSDVYAGGAEPYLSQDAKRLYFSEPDGIYKFEGLASDHTLAERVLDPEPDFVDSAPVLSADERWLYFRRTAKNDANGQIWRATHFFASDAFGPPKPVAELRGADDDSPSWLSPNDCRLYLQRAEAVMVAERNGCGSADLLTDEHNCGACQHACDSECIAGHCAPLTLATADALSSLFVRDGFAYFTDVRGVERVSVDGGMSERVTTADVSAAVVDRENVYFATIGAVSKVPRDVRGVAYVGDRVTSLSGRFGGEGVIALAVDSQDLFWIDPLLSDPGPSFLRRASTARGKPVTLLQLPVQVRGLAVDSSYAYFATDSALGRMPKTGGDVQVLTELYGYATEPRIDVALDSDFAYVIDGSSVLRVPKLGGASEAIVTTDAATAPRGLHLDADFVYYATSDGRIVKIRKDGSEPEDLAHDERDPLVGGVDERFVYWVERNVPDGNVRKVAK